MTKTSSNAAVALLRKLNSRGISIEAVDDRLSVSPKSLLTDEDRAAIRALKARLIGCLSPCSSHLNSTDWLREPLADRPGWEKASCRRCGRFIGFNRIGGPDDRSLTLGDAASDGSQVAAGGDGGHGGDDFRHLTERY